jgi:hypothetical protein
MRVRWGPGLNPEDLTVCKIVHSGFSAALENNCMGLKTLVGPRGRYRAYVENQIELRGTAGSQVDESFGSTPASETHGVQIWSPETSSHFPGAPKSRQALFTLPPIVWFFFVSFVILVTACLVGLYFFSHAAQH